MVVKTEVVFSLLLQSFLRQSTVHERSRPLGNQQSSYFSATRLIPSFNVWHKRLLWVKVGGVVFWRRSVKARSIYQYIPLHAFRHARLARVQSAPPMATNNPTPGKRGLMGKSKGQRRRDAFSSRNERVPLIRSVRGEWTVCLWTKLLPLSIPSFALFIPLSFTTFLFVPRSAVVPVSLWRTFYLRSPAVCPPSFFAPLLIPNFHSTLETFCFIYLPLGTSWAIDRK